ncbi:MAG: cation-translocating P-type ATPase [Promethearchaeota archaeon]
MERKNLDAHSLTIETLSDILNTSIQNGLSEEEAKVRLEKYGSNELKQVKKISALEIFISQFKDFLIYLLFGAIIFSLFVGFFELIEGNTPTEFLDAIVISIILVSNAILGFYQEYKAEKSLESLKKMAPRNATVKRNGKVREIDVENVIPGDLIILKEGDKVPADARLVKAFSLYVDESILTGESQPILKKTEVLKRETPLADRKNMVYSNTIITRGNGMALIINTGMSTEIGKIAEKIQEQEPELSPFQQEINRFGKTLGKIVILVCVTLFSIELILILMFAGNMPSGAIIEEILKAITITITLAVSAVPEGLVVVITVVMSIGMRKMAERNALVKRLTAVETLGRINIICSDKTGTLTRNEMTVVKIYEGGNTFAVDGVGYKLEGTILNPSGEPMKIIENPYLEKFLQVALYCNNSNVNIKEDGVNLEVVGDPTEICLKVLALKMGLAPNAEKLDEIPFNSDRKMMSVAVRIDGKLYSFIKGAPDVLLKKAAKGILNGKEYPIDEVKDLIMEKNNQFGNEALRVLGLAYKPLNENYSKEDLEKDYIYLGLAGIIDPPRLEVKDSIKKAKNGGIRTMMITGDHKVTAIAVGKEIGLTENDEAITGVELEEMDDAQLAQKIKNTNIFARVTSEQKLRILNILKSQNNVVCMTGDGVNDAPAVKAANVGVAMGINGTEVTQEAADMILLDDNYATIVNAIEEGRGIFNNTKNFFRYMLSVNFAEIFLILTAWILMSFTRGIFFAIPLEPIQILWLNIATDGIPAMVLGFTPTDPDVMKFKPRKGFNMISDIKNAIIFASVLNSIIDIILYVSCWTILIPSWSIIDSRFVYGTEINGIIYTGMEYKIAVAQTILFTSVVFFELFFVFSCISEYKPLWLFRNKHLFWATGISFVLHLMLLFTPLAYIFNAVPLDRWYYWLVVFSAALILPAEELRKYFVRRKLKKKEIIDFQDNNRFSKLKPKSKEMN